MFAVIKAGGKQYRVAEDQVLKVEGVKGEPGTIVQIGDVIMLGGDTPQLGSPMVEGASVAAEILEPWPRRQGHRLQEAPPQELAAQARPPAGFRADPHLGNPDRGRQADQGSEAEARGQGQARHRTTAPRTSRRPRRRPPRSRRPRPSRRPKQRPRERKSNLKPAKAHFVAPAGLSSQRPSIFV